MYISKDNYNILYDYLKKRFTKVDLNEMSKKDINMFVDITFNFAKNVFSTENLYEFNMLKENLLED